MAETIAELQTDIANLQVLINDTNDPTVINGLQATIDADNQQIALLQLCFFHGTRILTERGEICIEDLKIGDMVVTPLGSTASSPIRWIGRQHFEGARAVLGQPVIVRVGALGNGIPHRDLRVSGDHCLFLDGHLVPAKLLVNGTTIVSDSGHVVTNYLNIELDDHSVVLAEGAESETYLDCGNRGRFDNATDGSEWVASRPITDGSAWEHAFAPPLWDGPKLVALRARLAGRVLEPEVEVEAFFAPTATPEVFAPAWSA